MSLYLKLGLGLTTLSAVVIPGAWLMITAEPSSTKLANDDEPKYKGKFGEDFNHHFVDAREGKNQSWWDWSFKYRWEADSSNEKDEDFREVTNGSNLKEKCKLTYEKETKKDIHQNSKKQYEKSVWRYCSLEGQKPLTLEDLDLNNKKTKNTASVKTKHMKDLVSTTDSRNSKFWEIQEKAFFKSEKKEGLGGQEKNNSSIFKKLYEGKPEEDADTLMKACEKIFN